MLRVSLLTAVAALALTACDQTSAPSGSTESTTPTGSSSAPASQADQVSALAALSLDASGAGGVTFATVDVSGADHVFKGVKLTGPDAADGEALSIAEVRLANPRLDNGAPVFDSLVLSGLSFEGGTEETGAMTIGEVRLEGPNAATAALIAALFAGKDPEEGALSTKASDYAFKSWSVANVSVSSNDETDGVFNLGLAKISLDDLAAGALGAFVISGVKLDGTSPEGQAFSGTIHQLSINGLKAEFLDAFSDLDESDEAAFAAALASISGPGGVSDPYVKRYNDYQIAGLNLNIDGVKVSMPSATGSVQETKEGLVQKDDFGPLNVAFDTAGQLGAQAAMSTSMLGYETLEFSINSEYVADPVADRLYSKAYQIAMKDGFTLDASYDVAGVRGYLEKSLAIQDAMFAEPTDEAPDYAAALQEAYDALKLNGMTLTFKDQSIVEKGFTLAGAMMGQEPAQLREQAAVMLAMGGLGAPAGTEALVGQTITALQSFVRDPGTLTIKLAPQQPVSIGALMAAQEDPSAVISQIGYSIETTGK